MVLDELIFSFIISSKGHFFSLCNFSTRRPKINLPLNILEYLEANKD